MARPIEIPEDALRESFVRASGPGGQNVNKVSTAVQLRLEVAQLGWGQESLRKLRQLAGQRWTEAGEILIEASEHRTREANRESARTRLRDLLQNARRPTKKRRATRPTRASQERRLQEKKKRGQTKRQRGRID